MFLVRVPCHDRRVRSVPPTLEAPIQASIDGPSSALPRPAEDDNELAVVDVLVHALGVQAHSAAEPLADRRIEKDKCPSPPFPPWWSGASATNLRHPSSLRRLARWIPPIRQTGVPARYRKGSSIPRWTKVWKETTSPARRRA